MSSNWQIPRRKFLKGLGVTMALPFLDAMSPVKAIAGISPKAKAPVRMAFLYVPNGANMPDWTPLADGANFDLPAILRPLAPVKNDINVLTGLTHDKGRANGDGPGDHARSAASFLTGSQPLKSEGSSIRAGVSVDQLAASYIGNQTRFPSLEIGIESGRQSGKCDSGYSCAYSNNIAWRNESTPLAKETNPRLVFERLFGNDLTKEMSENRAKRELYKKSILDFVLEDANRLKKQVSGADRYKLDEYLTAIREIELRIERTEQSNRELANFVPNFDKPAGIPDSFEDHCRLMGDMMVLAFQTDVTRICTFMFANEGSNKSYSNIGVTEGHHNLSHHQNDPEKLAQIRDINEFHVEQLAYILQKLKSTPDGDSNLLDNSMILYGSGISDGNRHNHDNLPILMAGRAGGSIRSGRHIVYPQETPMTNLFVSMLERVGVSAPAFGDSTGHLNQLEG